MADQERKNHNNDSRSNRQISIAKVCRQVIEHLGECLEDYEQLFEPVSEIYDTLQSIDEMSGDMILQLDDMLQNQESTNLAGEETSNQPKDQPDQEVAENEPVIQIENNAENNK